LGLDPLNPDTDGDGLPDGYEFRILGTDPTRKVTYGANVPDVDLDMDKDGLSNWDEFLYGTEKIQMGTALVITMRFVLKQIH